MDDTLVTVMLDKDIWVYTGQLVDLHERYGLCRDAPIAFDGALARPEDGPLPNPRAFILIKPLNNASKADLEAVKGSLSGVLG